MKGHVRITVSWFYFGLLHFIMNGKSKFFIDDKFISELSLFQILEIELPSGRHSIHVEIGGYAAKPITLYLESGETREYVCKPARPFFTLFYDPLRNQDEYLIIEAKVIKIKI
jgi:hypothetical protein